VGAAFRKAYDLVVHPDARADGNTLNDPRPLSQAVAETLGSGLHAEAQAYGREAGTSTAESPSDSKAALDSSSAPEAIRNASEQDIPPIVDPASVPRELDFRKGDSENAQCGPSGQEENSCHVITFPGRRR
jgi:hypothetical protein